MSEPLLPRVTGVLHDVGFVDPQWYTDEARKRGTAVHVACHHDDENDLAEDKWDPAILLYVQSWRLAREAAGFSEMIAIEKRLTSTIYGFTGTPDRVLRLRSGLVAVIDLKSGAPHRATSIQTAGYALLVREALGLRVDKRYAVHLQADGSIGKLVPYNDPHDEAVFLAALTTVRWRTRA